MNEKTSAPPLRVWRQAVALALGPAVVLGFGRFSYALMLPPMQKTLHWSIALAGDANASNAAGYLVGAMLADACARRFGTRRSFLVSLWVTVFTLWGLGLVISTPAIFFWRFAAGFAGAVTFVLGATLAARLERPDRPWVLGVYSGGVGLGIAISAVVVPFLLSGDGARWPEAWLLLGAFGVLAAWWAGHGTQVSAPVAPQYTHQGDVATRHLWPAYGAYGLFGLGYIAYMTFIVAYLKTHAAPPGVIFWFWAILGLCATVSNVLWQRWTNRFKPGRTLALMMGVLALGGVLPMWWIASPGFILSAVLFGGSFLAVVTEITALVRHELPYGGWARAIGLFTVVFAVGQVAGPVLTGIVAQGSGSVASGLWLSAGLLALGGGLSLWPHRSRSPVVP